MARSLVAVAVLGLLAGGLCAEEHLGLPKGPQPQEALARMNPDGQLVLVQLVPEYRAETRTKTVKDQTGVERALTYTVTVQVMRPQERRVDGKVVQVYGTDGKKIDPDRLPELLRKDTHVLVSADGQKVDPFYLEIVKEGTLVLVLPALTAPPGPAPVPVAPPPVVDK